MRADPAPPTTLLLGAVELFGAAVGSIGPHDWDRPTPCTEWDVRQLVNHVTGEDLWAERLFAGATIAEVGDALDGDLLGARPLLAWEAAARAVGAAARTEGVLAATVQLSFGEVPGSEYAMQLFADHLVHSWDLLTAIGSAARLPADLVAACLPWMTANEDAYRQAGLIGRRPGPLPASPAGAGHEQTILLAMFGRTS